MEGLVLAVVSWVSACESAIARATCDLGSHAPENQPYACSNSLRRHGRAQGIRDRGRFRGQRARSARLEKLPNDATKLRRLFERLSREGEVRACYEASGAGYVLQRLCAGWGIHCDLVAPSLIPTRPGERRKHDKRDALQLARLDRAGELVLVRIPSEAEERVRDLVRCSETFQRGLVRSRHYLLKFLRRLGFIYREGEYWTARHVQWLRRLHTQGMLADEERIAFGEYLSLLEYKLQRRDDLDRRIEEITLQPAYKPLVERLRCFRGTIGEPSKTLWAEVDSRTQHPCIERGSSRRIQFLPLCTSV